MVGQDFAGEKVDKDTLFAETPSSGALRLLISGVASNQHCGYVLMTADIKPACLYAPVGREVFIGLPPEDPYSSTVFHAVCLLKPCTGQGMLLSFAGFLGRTVSEDWFGGEHSHA